MVSDFRLEIVNKLVDFEILEKELTERNKYQNMFIPLLGISSFESANDLDDHIQVDSASFTDNNNDIIDDIEDKKSKIILDFISTYPADHCSRLQVDLVLEQSQQIISSAKQIPRIEKIREVRLERGALENRVRALIHDSDILLGSLSRSEVTSRQKLNLSSKISCLAALKHTLKNAQLLTEGKVCLKTGCREQEKDMSLTLRLAQVRDRLLQLNRTHSRCIKEIAIIKDDIQVVRPLHSSVPPSPRRLATFPFELVVDPIETFLKTSMIRFFEKDQMTIPQIQNVDTPDLAFHIRTNLEKVIVASDFALDDDTREILHKIWNHTSSESPDGSLKKTEVSDSG